jgi:hypothetical protein
MVGAKKRMKKANRGGGDIQGIHFYRHKQSFSFE